MSEQASRRHFLVTSACAGAGVCAGLAMGCGGEGQGGTGGTPNEPIGDPNYYGASPRQPMAPMDNSMPMCPSTAGLIQGPASSSLAVNQRSPMLYGGRLVICRSSDNGLYALDLTCPHAGCQPALQDSSQYWVCPCHGSTFEIDGTFVLGPAQRPLKRYFVCEGSDGRLYIDTSKPI